MNYARNKLMGLVGAEGYYEEDVCERPLRECVGVDDDGEIRENLDFSNLELLELKQTNEEQTAVGRLYIKDTVARQEAREELVEAVEGVEALFKEGYTPEAYSILMRHANRCADRAGIKMPVNVNGCESLTEASVYVNHVQGTEGFLDTLKDVGRGVKDFIIKVYKFLVELIKGKVKEVSLSGRSLADLRDKLKTYKGTINPTTILGDWVHGLESTYKEGASIHSNIDMAIKILKFSEIMSVEQIMATPFDRVDIWFDFVGESFAQIGAKQVKRTATETTYTLDVGKVGLTLTVGNNRVNNEKDLQTRLRATKLRSRFRRSDMAVGSEVPALFKSTQQVVDTLDINSKKLEEERTLLLKLSDEYKKEGERILARLEGQEVLHASATSAIALKEALLEAAFDITGNVANDLQDCIEAHYKKQ